jgi:hypothetical protein
VAAVARKTFRGVPCFGFGKCYIVQRAGARIVDKIYEFQDGGASALAQFGQRRGFYGTVAYDF